MLLKQEELTNLLNDIILRYFGIYPIKYVFFNIHGVLESNVEPLKSTNSNIITTK